MPRIDIRAAALTVGILWGLAMMFVGWAAGFGWGEEFVRVNGSVYLGYAPGLVGGIIGFMWGFLDGVIATAVGLFLYDRIASASRTRQMPRAGAPMRP